jgi:hypothetical protein
MHNLSVFIEIDLIILELEHGLFHASNQHTSPDLRLNQSTLFLSSFSPNCTLNVTTILKEIEKVNSSVFHSTSLDCNITISGVFSAATQNVVKA